MSNILLPQHGVIVGELRDGPMICRLVARGGKVVLQFTNGPRSAQQVEFAASSARKMAALMLEAAKVAE